MTKGRLPKGYLGIFPKLLSPPPPLGTLGITIVWEKPLFSKRPPCSLIWEKLQLKKEIVIVIEIVILSLHIAKVV